MWCGVCLLIDLIQPRFNPFYLVKSCLMMTELNHVPKYLIPKHQYCFQVTQFIICDNSWERIGKGNKWVKYFGRSLVKFLCSSLEGANEPGNVCFLTKLLVSKARDLKHFIVCVIALLAIDCQMRMNHHGHLLMSHLSAEIRPVHCFISISTFVHWPGKFFLNLYKMKIECLTASNGRAFKVSLLFCQLLANSAFLVFYAINCELWIWFHTLFLGWMSKMYVSTLMLCLPFHLSVS